MSPLGVFGGTFDPVHFGHIYPVLDVLNKTGMKEVRFIPNSQPPHRSRPKISASHRWNMLLLALKDYPELIADEREIRRPGASYMVPTLRSFRQEFHLRPICLMLGMDAFAQIQTWYWWACVLKLANIVVMNRPGFDARAHRSNWSSRAFIRDSRALGQRTSGSICHVRVEPVSLSATQIRRKLERGIDVSGDMPEAVFEYLTENRLYTKLTR